MRKDFFPHILSQPQQTLNINPFKQSFVVEKSKAFLKTLPTSSFLINPVLEQ